MGRKKAIYTKPYMTRLDPLTDVKMHKKIVERQKKYPRFNPSDAFREAMTLWVK